MKTQKIKIKEKVKKLDAENYLMIVFGAFLFFASYYLFYFSFANSENAYPDTFLGVFMIIAAFVGGIILVVVGLMFLSSGLCDKKEKEIIKEVEIIR